MSYYEILSLCVALLAAVIAFVSLYRTRQLAIKQLELQKEQVKLAAKSAELAQFQIEDRKAAELFPELKVSIYQYDVNDTAVELTFENSSSLNRSLNNCSVGLLDKETDPFPRVARAAEYEDGRSTYPIAISPYSSLILFSFGRRLKPIYEKRYGHEATDAKPVAVIANFSGMPEALFKVIGTYSPDRGLQEN